MFFVLRPIWRSKAHLAFPGHLDFLNVTLTFFLFLMPSQQWLKYTVKLETNFDPVYES